MTLHVYSATGNVVGLLLYRTPKPQELRFFFQNPIDQILVSDIKHHITIYNKDGSRALQCGNGLRALATHLKRKKITLFINNTSYPIQRIEQAYWVNLGKPTQPIEQKQHEGIPYHEVHLGNDHLIFDKQWKPHLHMLQKKFSNDFNLSFVDISPSNIEIETFERGSGWTEACGSACAASTYIAHTRYPQIHDWTAINAGGTIKMSLTPTGILQTGNVQKLYTL